MPDESYGTGEPLEKLTVPVQWAGPAANGLRLGLAGLGKGDKWAFGSEHALEIYLRNDGNEPVKFSWTPRADEGLSLLLTDDEGRDAPRLDRHVERPAHSQSLPARSWPLS